MQHVRTIDGVQTATPGRWTIVGQRSRLRFGRDNRTARILYGALIIGDEPSDIALHLTVMAGSNRATIDAQLASTHSGGRWRFTGQARTHDDVLATVVDVCYHGVYRHADRTSAWLTIRVELAQTPEATTSGPCRNAVLVSADVHANPPVTDGTTTPISSSST